MEGANESTEVQRHPKKMSILQLRFVKRLCRAVEYRPIFKADVFSFQFETAISFVHLMMQREREREREKERETQFVVCLEVSKTR